MTEKLLSIALPVRNGANFLAEALDSILAQTWGDFELFVSDNASDDATPDILADYARRDARIKISRSAELIPQIPNTMRAIALTNTPWVKLFCHDDLMRADCMEQVASAVRQVANTRVALIGNGERHLYENGYLTAGEADGPLQILAGHDALRTRCSRAAHEFVVPSITTATVRRDAFQLLGGFDRRFVYFEIFAWYELLVDWDFARIPAALTVNRIHGRQVAADARGSLRSAQDHRLYFSEFLERHAARLSLGTLARGYARLIGPGRAAHELAVEIEARRLRRAAQMVRHMPGRWLPLIPLLTLRALRSERKRVAHLAEKVPLELIYP